MLMAEVYPQPKAFGIYVHKLGNRSKLCSTYSIRTYITYTQAHTHAHLHACTSNNTHANDTV